MSKIYYNKYKKMIDDGLCTVDEAIEKAKAEVPARWKDAVVELLELM